MVKHRTRRVHHRNKSFKMMHRNPTPSPIGECCDATFHGLGHWYKHLFEELGWMILAKSRGMTDKIAVYLNSITRCKMAIEQKIHKTRDSDKKEDLKIMHHNIVILMEHAQKDLI